MMPTTRLTAVKTTSGSDASTSPSHETQVESRQARFEARKKPEPLTDASPIQKLMIQFLQVVLNVDTHRLLWTKPEQENSIDWETIEDRVYKGKYKDLSSLKSDFDELLLSILPCTRSSNADMDAFKKLYTFTENSLRFESKRLNEPFTESDLIQLSSLFRPTADGYAFTDMVMKDPSAGPFTKLPPNVQEIMIHPAPPATKDQVPSLLNVVAPPPKYFPKLAKHEDKPVVPIRWLDFGAFASFAPASDSNNANATYENTYMGRSAKRFKKWEKRQLEKPREEITSEDKEANSSWAEKEGLDMDAIEAALNKEPENVSEALERNSQLLQDLVEYQKSRFNGIESAWTQVDEKEVEIAKTLEKNMTDMLSKLPPNATTSVEVIEETMERLPLYESAYRGTLPPHKIFSFPTTEKAENLPPYANITPTYSKDNWCLVKVSPLPTDKDVTYPPLSMIEQQQLNFYSKPPFSATNNVPQQQQQQQQQQRMPYNNSFQRR
ncbi:hypothetical protein MFLAVUS_009007 [Mucor flavus]|uniref:Uncharacterized protein n=1 Tax=Mucor flavus TaxID=439312 RepID=A0ABP9Z8P9_9FUNG